MCYITCIIIVGHRLAEVAISLCGVSIKIVEWPINCL